MQVHSRAFTVIELLVVIAILAIIAALLFPVVSRAQSSSFKITCASNMRQIGVASQLYAADADDGLPTWSEFWFLRTNPDISHGIWGDDLPSGRWQAKLKPYVKSAPENGGIWRCPESNEPAFHSTLGVSQGLMCDQSGDSAKWRYPTSNLVEDASNVIFLGDAGREGRISPPYNFDGYKDRYLDNLSYYRRDAPWRHSGGANYVFVDGHSKWRSAAELFPAPIPLGTQFGVAHLGRARCAMADFFAPNLSEAISHRKYALEHYATTCPVH